MKPTYLITLTLTFIFASTIFQVNAQDECTARYRAKVFQKVSLDGQIDYESYAKYLNGQILRYDIYSPKGDTAGLRPCIILWHGGAFVEAIKKNSPEIVPVAKDLAKMGYVVVTPDYRGIRNLLDFGQTETLIKTVVKATLDGNDAVCHILSEIENGNPHRINPNEIFAGGTSAGAILGLHGLFLKNLDDMNPQYAAWGRQVDNGRADAVLSNKFCGHPNVIKAFFSISGAVVDTSIIHHTDIKLLFVHGTKDNFVPYNVGSPLWGLTAAPDLYGSKPIEEKCEQLGIESSLMTIEGGGHVPYLNLDLESLEANHFSLFDDRKYQEILHRISDFLFAQVTCEKQKDSTVTTALQNNRVQTVKVFPNPASDYIQLDIPQSDNWDIDLYDLSGRNILHDQMTGNSKVIPINNLSIGAYIIRITNPTNPENNYIGKFIKSTIL